MKAPVPTKRAVSVLTWVAILAVIVLVVWLIGRVAALSDAAESARDRSAERGDQLSDLTTIVGRQGSALDLLQQRCRQAKGCTPIDTDKLPESVPGLPGDRGETGERGPRGYSCIEEIGRAACRGDQGSTGGSGTDGQDGQDGANGSDGADSTVPGPQGPPGADGADSTVPGPKGDKGDKGDPGSVTPGTYGCPAGQYIEQINVGADGSMSVVCSTPPIVPSGG